MHRRVCLSLALIALLGGCAATPPSVASDPAPRADAWQRWVCDNQTPVLWRRAGEDALDVRVGGGDIAHRLRRQPSASGELYRDEILAFHLKGEEGMVYRVADNTPIGTGCKAR